MLSDYLRSFISSNENNYYLFPGGSECKESACNSGDMGSIPGLGRFPGGGNGNPLVFLPGEFYGLFTVHGVVAKSPTCLSD